MLLRRIVRSYQLSFLCQNPITVYDFPWHIAEKKREKKLRLKPSFLSFFLSDLSLFGFVQSKAQRAMKRNSVFSFTLLTLFISCSLHFQANAAPAGNIWALDLSFFFFLIPFWSVFKWVFYFYFDLSVVHCFSLKCDQIMFAFDISLFVCHHFVDSKSRMTKPSLFGSLNQLKVFFFFLAFFFSLIDVVLIKLWTLRTSD